jgi:hypothetical protein
VVCLSFNASYLPFVAGACMQLMQPTTWQAATEDELAGILANMAQLIEVIGTAVQCNEVPSIGPSPGQQTCNLAGYLANFVIRNSMAKAISDIQNNYNVLSYGMFIMGFIPGFGGVFGVALTALNNLYHTISSGTLADYQTAVADDTYFGQVTCAIYAAILPEGQVTVGNFPTLLSNVDAISYTLLDVKAAVHDFLNTLGASGLQAVQPSGALADYDCTHCGGTGPALGPAGPQPRQISGTDLLQIGIGFADAVQHILFPAPFPSPPLLTVGTDNELLLASYQNVTATGFDAVISASVPVASTQMANYDYIALPAGSD